MRVYPFAIQRYPHYIMTYNPVLYGWIFYVLILPKEPQAFTANHRPNREFRKNKICRNFKIFVRYYRKFPLL